MTIDFPMPVEFLPAPAATIAVGLLYVVSGCSGSGKSTLIAALAQQGEAVSYEPGRQIVQEEMNVGGDGLPWKNLQRFIDLCAARAIAEFNRHAHRQRRTFFDRSFIDVASAVERTGLIAPEILRAALQSKRYAPLVFIAPPWEALFRPDAERRHGFAEAVAEYEALVPTYERLGYEVVFLPQTSVMERVSFVLSTISRISSTDRADVTRYSPIRKLTPATNFKARLLPPQSKLRAERKR